jgi:hypothetical protein
MGNDKDWVLLANAGDKTLLRAGIGFKVGELLGFPWTPKARFVEVFLNGEYIGNYQIVEAIKQDSKRVDIPEETGFLIEWDGYYYLEPKWFKTNIVNSRGYSFKHPETEDMTDDQYNYIKDYMNEFESVLYSTDSADPVNGYQKYIDADSFVRWFLSHNAIANIDMNFYVTKADGTANSKLHMGPVWDFEWSMGIGWYDGPRPRPANYWVCNGWYYEKLLTDEAFVTKLQTMWNVNKIAIRQGILQYMEEAKVEIMKSQKFNFRRWDVMNTENIYVGRPMGSFEAEFECNIQFFNNHMDWLDTAINELDGL